METDIKTLLAHIGSLYVSDAAKSAALQMKDEEIAALHRQINDMQTTSPPAEPEAPRDA